MVDDPNTPFRRGEYSPELLSLMGAALERAWETVQDVVQDVDLARLLMAGTIIERVDDGMLDPEDLVAAATQALRAATNLFKPRD